MVYEENYAHMEAIVLAEQAAERRERAQAAEAAAAMTAKNNQYYADGAAAAAAGGAEKGDYRVGDMVFYTGVGKTFKSGGVLVHGGKGAVADVGVNKGRIGVLFTGNKCPVDCKISNLSRTAPPTRVEMGGRRRG